MIYSIAYYCNARGCRYVLECQVCFCVYECFPAEIKASAIPVHILGKIHCESRIMKLITNTQLSDQEDWLAKMGSTPQLPPSLPVHR